MSKMSIFRRALRKEMATSEHEALDMSTAARMARADKSHPVTAYRGSLSDDMARPEGAPNESGWRWFADNPSLANQYAKFQEQIYIPLKPDQLAPHVGKYRLNTDNAFNIDAKGKIWRNIDAQSLADAGIPTKVIKEILTKGGGYVRSSVVTDVLRKRFPGRPVVFKNVVDHLEPITWRNVNDTSTVYAVPTTGGRIRYSTAAFDPAKKDSSDLLAAAPLTAALGAASMNEQKKPRTGNADPIPARRK